MTQRIRNLRQNGLLCCIVLLLSLGMRAVDEAPHPFFSFFVITDVQLGMFDHDQDLSRESDNLEKFVAAANRLGPAFIVNCGDMVKGGQCRGNPALSNNYGETGSAHTGLQRGGQP
jgi:serine/threonine-protein phosphatase CPPED1